MKTLFKEIHDIEGVFGVILNASNGDILYADGASPRFTGISETDWWDDFIKAIAGIREADFVFEHGRIYVRQTDNGHLIVLMRDFTPSAMVRLSCDVILPALKQTHPARKTRRFFRRK